MLGLKVATSETRQAWNVFSADLVARGLTGVLLVTSDAHHGLTDAMRTCPAPPGNAAAPTTPPT